MSTLEKDEDDSIKRRRDVAYGQLVMSRMQKLMSLMAAATAQPS